MPAPELKNVTPLDRIESIKAQISAMSTEADEICALAANENRSPSETEATRLLDLMGENNDGMGEGCLQRDLYDELETWTKIQTGMDQRERNRAITTPSSVVDVTLPSPSDLPGLRRSFPMGCNRPVIVPNDHRFGGRELDKFGDAWGTTRNEREENAYAGGMWIIAHMWPHHPDAQNLPIVSKARQWCRDHGILNQQDESTATKGIELVPKPLESSIIEIREMYGVMRRFARIYPMTSKTLDVPKFTSGLSVGLVAELAAQVITEAAWSQVNLIAKKAGGFAQWSTEVGEDAIISLAADLARDFGIAFAQREDITGFTGDGVADFANMGITGIIATLDAAATITLAATNDNVTDITLLDYESLLGLITNTTVNLQWFMHKSVYYASVHPLKTAAGGNTIATLTDGDPVSAGSDFRFLGVEGTWTNVLPDSSSGQSVAGVVILGDLSRGVAFGDRRGVTIQVDNSIKIIEDAIVMTANSRFDIQTHADGATADQRVIAMITLGTTV